MEEPCDNDIKFVIYGNYSRTWIYRVSLVLVINCLRLPITIISFKKKNLNSISNLYIPGFYWYPVFSQPPTAFVANYFVERPLSSLKHVQRVRYALILQGCRTKIIQLKEYVMFDSAPLNGCRQTNPPSYPHTTAHFKDFERSVVPVRIIYYHHRRHSLIINGLAGTC